MDAEEIEIFHYLKTWGSNFVNAKEICRRANKRFFVRDNNWAREPLSRMEDQGIVESDNKGRYRLKSEEEEEGHVAPLDAEKLLNDDGEEIASVHPADADADEVPGQH